MKSYVFQTYEFSELDKDIQDKLINYHLKVDKDYLFSVFEQNPNIYDDFIKYADSLGFDVDPNYLVGLSLAAPYKFKDNGQFNLRDIDLNKLNNTTHIFKDLKDPNHTLNVFVDNLNLNHNDGPTVILKTSDGKEVFTEEIEQAVVDLGDHLLKYRKALYEKYVNYDKVKELFSQDNKTLYFKNGESAGRVTEDNQAICLDSKQEKALNKLLKPKEKVQ